MTEVLHTADTHVGYRQYNSPARRADFLSAFERVLEDAVDRDVDAVVHAGDLFHDRRPGLQDLLGTVDALRILEEADIPFLAIVGNHEGKRDAQWLDLFETLGLATRLDAEGTVVGDLTLYGLDYVPGSRRDDLDYEFAAPETDAAALVAHGQFAPLAPSVHRDTWDVETVVEGANVDLGAVLLGDEHEHGQDEVAGARVTYCGSTERTSASERDERGYNLVGVDPGGDGPTVEIRRKGIETRPFRFVDVELHEGEGVERVRERVREYDLDDAVVVVTVTGDGEPVAPAEVEELARERGALIARVNDRREIETEAEAPDVSFADPDEAVRDRVREMGLSGAARGVDEVVRADGVADSNVRERVEDRVETLLDDDPGAFEGGAGSDDETGDANPEPDDGAGKPGEATAEPGGETGEPEAEPSGETDEQAPEDQASMEEYL